MKHGAEGPRRAGDSPRRRALTNVGGEVDTSGAPEEALALARALDVSPEEEEDAPDRAHVHGFHAYPARTHPVTARRLVEAFAGEAGPVLDPFCGSGTVLVEAMLAGRDAIGTDLNPLGVMLARAKTYPRTPAQTAALVAAAEGVAAFADARRKKKAGATRRLPREDVALFAPHVLLELDSIRAGVEGCEDGPRGALELVLSAILVKVGRKASDTAGHQVARRIAAGYPARLFVKKTEELCRRLAELEKLLPPGTPAARVALDDATRLRSVPAATIDAVVTSPPYVATYDYLAHHGLRLRWLGLDAREFETGETGSRRRYARMLAPEARAAWTRELGAILKSLARVCRKGARVVLLVADSAVQEEALRADAILSSLAPGAGFEPIARASQRRPHFHGPTARAFQDTPRAEHAIALEKR